MSVARVAVIATPSDTRRNQPARSSRDVNRGGPVETTQHGFESDRLILAQKTGGSIKRYVAIGDNRDNTPEPPGCDPIPSTRLSARTRDILGEREQSGGETSEDIGDTSRGCPRDHRWDVWERDRRWQEQTRNSVLLGHWPDTPGVPSTKHHEHCGSISGRKTEDKLSPPCVSAPGSVADQRRASGILSGT
jgi:hypothetical protein